MAAPPINELSTTVEQVRLLGLDVLNWRFEELERAGYPTDIAVMLAERGEVDLHDACDLLTRGATIHQALSILT
jgi:hypothetical protein